MLNLSSIEARVVGCLIEKEITTPEYYPLSLNALVNACNQKSSREPVMSLSEADVRTALFELENMGMVRVLADARVSKFEHLLYNKLNLKRPEIAIICLLLLRGPQTPAELRSRAERLYAFEDTGSVADTLDRLAARSEPMEPLVRQLSRQPGARENRWRHLLSGADDSEPREISVSPQTSEPRADRLAALEQAVADLLARVEALEGKQSAVDPAS